MVPSAVLRVAVVDRQPLFIRGLAALLATATEGRAEVVGATGEAGAAAGLMNRCVPDLALVDLHLAAPGSIRAIGAIRDVQPRLRVVAMSERDEHDDALAALRAGADGYLPKAREPEDVVPMLRTVFEGWSVLPTDLLAAVLGLSKPRSPVPVELDPDERQLLRLIAQGCGTLEISNHLHVSDRTVKRLTAALLRKLRVGTRCEAAALAGNAGLV
ncbi:response regulator transcription factor [Asanoa sp. WMMD1127]|uniref:response regulator n=1 Tax=Asanoa sp. WMMD1127 TaxID=3016107 RepID=UPI002417AD74|nr:response regulator transcription factor [Asanoa sp. WMMD1127]MDG4826899.1 response regulator transcription factor [Asanoa sp. WMMD1127]